MEEEEESGGGAGWLVSFADLMTLLFAAFVVLYGITPSGESDEILGVIVSIKESFIEIPDEITDGTARNALLEGKVSFTSAIRESFRNPAIKKYNRDSNPLRNKNLDLNQVDIDNNERSKGKGIHTNLRKAEQVARYEVFPQFRRIEMVFFKPGAHELGLSAREVLRLIGDELRQSRVKIYLEGHTQKKVMGRKHTNLELSVLRASAVKRHLVSKLGIPEKRILTTGYGSLRPSATGQKDRVEIKVRMD